MLPPACGVIKASQRVMPLTFSIKARQCRGLAPIDRIFLLIETVPEVAINSEPTTLFTCGLPLMVKSLPSPKPLAVVISGFRNQP